MNRDWSTGIVGAIAGAGLIFMAFLLPPSTVPDDIGPTAFPVFAGLLMLIPSLFLIFQKAPAEKEKPFMNREEWKRFITLLAVFALYAILLWAVGFIIATPIVTTIIGYLFGKDRKIALWKIILFSIILTIIIYVSFYTMLGMKLPVGKFIKIII